MLVACVQYLYYLTCHKLLKFLLRASVDISAVDPATLRRPLIIAANHPSRIDPFLLVLLPFWMVRRIIPLHFMTAAIYYDRWWIGPLARHIGSYRLAPTGRTVEDYLGDSLKLLLRRRTVVLFPVGQLSVESVERPA
jgi:1-acyl-sn-glycerol-3-phosphate acyltransferase